MFGTWCKCPRSVAEGGSAAGRVRLAQRLRDVPAWLCATLAMLSELSCAESAAVPGLIFKAYTVIVKWLNRSRSLVCAPPHPLHDSVAECCLNCCCCKPKHQHALCCIQCASANDLNAQNTPCTATQAASQHSRSTVSVACLVEHAMPLSGQRKLSAALSS
jgi:hypothetical protein